MALRETITIPSTTTSNGYTLKLELTENSVSTADNTSSVSWRLYLTSGSWHFSTYHIGWSVRLNGTVVSSMSRASSPQLSIAKHGEVTVKSGTATVSHSADGTLNMAAAASIDMDTDSHTPGPMSLSGSMALTAIPRASTLTAANGTLGAAQTLTINRAVSGYTHTLTYACGAASDTILSNSSAASVSWTPPLTLAQQNTTGQTVSVTFTLTTKNGSSTVGTSTKTVSMAIPPSVKPAVTAAVGVVNDNATISGWGVAVKGYSKYKVTTTFTGAQGSTQKSRSVKVSATGENLTASPATSAVLSSTNRLVKVTVTDSRNRQSAEVSVSGPVIYDYGQPAITTATAFRCNSAGTADDTGTYISAKCSGSVYSCGGHNAKTVQCRRRATGGSWTGWTALTDNTVSVINAGLSVASACEVQFRVSDSLGNSRTVTVTIPTAAVTLNLRPGGRGAAFGKYAEADDELQVAWDLKLDNPLEVASGGTGQTTVRQIVAVTADTAVFSSHSVTVRYFPYLGMCFVRGYAQLDHRDVAANTYMNIATVPPEYAPLSYTALSAAGLGGPVARLTSQSSGQPGTFQIAFREARTSGYLYDVYFSGWWFYQ